MIKVHLKIFELIKISFLATTRTNYHTLTTLSTIVFEGTASQEEYTGKYLSNKIYVNFLFLIIDDQWKKTIFKICD